MHWSILVEKGRSDDLKREERIAGAVPLSGWEGVGSRKQRMRVVLGRA